jgi:TetR/AcrR family transcriptional regulator, mexJK operon transcriptional repressor
MNDEGVLRIADVQRAAWQFLELCQAGTFKPLLFRMVDELTRSQIEAGVQAGVDVFMAAYGAAPVRNPIS